MEKDKELFVQNDINEEIEIADENGESAQVQSKNETDENYERLIRLTADFDNFRKRVIKEKSDMIKYGNESLVRELLPVIDNFQRAVDHSKNAKDIESIQKGIEMILHQLLSTLSRFGIKSESTLGKEFDPMIHDAMSHVVSDEHEPNTVMAEFEKAYYLHEKLIRPAKVAVSKKTDETPGVTDKDIDQPEESFEEE